MTSFLDCIKTSVESGRINKKKGDEIEVAYNNAIADGIAEGLTDQAARDAASGKALENVLQLTADKRWQKINEIRKADAIYRNFNTAKNLPRAMDDFMDGVEIAYDRIRGQAMALMDGNLEKYRPTYAGLVHSVRDMDDIVRAAYGGNASKEAKELYNEIAAVQSFLRERANMEGASIPENKNRRLPQTHDRLKVRQVPKDQWINEHLDALDWTVMRYHDRPIAPANRREILEKTYESIVTDGASRMTPGHTQVDHLATRLAKERFLYYKDADSYISMQKKYGSGNVFQQTIGMIDSYARDISMLEKFGPNPVAMKSFMHNVIQMNAAKQDLAIGATGKKSVQKKAEEAFDTLTKRYDIHTLNVLNGEENAMAQTFATVRTTVMATTLSGAYLANLSDITFAKHAALTMKLPMMGHTRAYIKNFIPNKQNRSLAIRSGLIAESAVSMASSYQRYFGPLDGANWAKRYSDVINRVGLLTPHTQAAKHAWGMEMLGLFHDTRGTKFDDLAHVKLFRDNGITEADWDLFRSTPVFNENGGELLRPVDLYWRKDGNSLANKRTADKFLDLIQTTSRIAVPSTTGRVRAMLGGDTSPATLMGQVARTFGSLKSFPATLMMLHGREMMREATIGGKLKYAATFFAFLTMGGAFVTQLKELGNGRDPLDMATPQFWGRAVMNGGSLGMLGDMVFNNVNANGGGLAENMAGPLVEFADDTRNLTIGNLEKLLTGKETSATKEAVRYLASYGPRVWQVRLLLDRLINDMLLKNGDPAAYTQLQRNTRKRLHENNQDMWWAPGKSPRLPNLKAAVGGSR